MRLASKADEKRDSLNVSVRRNIRFRLPHQVNKRAKKYKKLKGLGFHLGLFSYGSAVAFELPVTRSELTLNSDKIAIYMPASMPNHWHGQNQSQKIGRQAKAHQDDNTECP